VFGKIVRSEFLSWLGLASVLAENAASSSAKKRNILPSILQCTRIKHPPNPFFCYITLTARVVRTKQLGVGGDCGVEAQSAEIQGSTEGDGLKLADHETAALERGLYRPLQCRENSPMLSRGPIYAGLAKMPNERFQRSPPIILLILLMRKRVI